jgi:hypothetical protein
VAVAWAGAPSTLPFVNAIGVPCQRSTRGLLRGGSRRADIENWSSTTAGRGTRREPKRLRVVIYKKLINRGTAAEEEARTLYAVFEKGYQADIFNMMQGLISAVTQVLLDGFKFLHWRL